MPLIGERPIPGGSHGLEAVMFPHLPNLLAGRTTVTPLWTDQVIAHRNGPLYLLLAATALVIALWLIKRALTPIGTLVHAVATAAAAAVAGIFAIGVALVFVAAAALGWH
jgi:hypothetical protein